MPQPSTQPSRAARRRPREDDLAALLESLRAGDSQALARLFDATSRIVFALALRLLGDAHIAEEVTLDVYLQVWRRAASYEVERGGVAAWLLTIARSRALDRRRALAVRARAEEQLHSEQLLDACDPPCGSVSAPLEPFAARCLGERAEIVRGALLALPEDQRRAIELAFFEGLSHTEVASRLDQPLGTVKTRIRLGMLKLKDALQPLEVER